MDLAADNSMLTAAYPRKGDVGLAVERKSNDESTAVLFAHSQDSCQDFPPLFLTAFSIILENPEES